MDFRNSELVSHSCCCSIEDDILNLVDEIDIDSFLREAALSLDNPENLSDFIRDKTAVAIERFLVSDNLFFLF